MLSEASSEAKIRWCPKMLNWVKLWSKLGSRGGADPSLPPDVLVRCIMRLGGAVVTRSSLTAMAWVRLLSPGHMWDVFHPSQPMPGGFPLRGFLPPSEGLEKLFRLEPSHKANWPGQNLFWVT